MESGRIRHHYTLHAQPWHIVEEDDQREGKDQAQVQQVDQEGAEAEFAEEEVLREVRSNGMGRGPGLRDRCQIMGGHHRGEVRRQEGAAI